MKMLRMDRLGINISGITVVLTAALFTVTIATDVRWDMDESDWGPFTENDDVTIKCLVRHLNSRFSAVSIERELNGHSQLIVTNQVVEDAFRNLMYEGTRRYTSRFELLHENSGYMGVLQLKIKSIRGEDAAKVRCKAEGETSPLRLLAVRVPVDAVHMRAFHSNGTSSAVPDGSTVYMRENMRSGVACAVIVRTHLIRPEVSLTSGGQNVTQLFSYDEPTMVKDEDEASTTTVGIQPLNYRWQYSFYTLRPSNQLHDQRLTCSAFSVGFEDNIQTASVFMDVEFRPIIMCANYEYYGYVGGSVTMSCSVKSNPKSQIVFRFGYYLSDNRYNISRPFIADNRYIFTRIESEGGMSNMTFTMRNLRKAHFDYTYKIDAKNKYGSASVTLLLYESMVIGATATRTYHPVRAYLLLVSLLTNRFTSCLQR